MLLKDRIVAEWTNLFVRNGVKWVRMEQISRPAWASLSGRILRIVRRPGVADRRMRAAFLCVAGRKTRPARRIGPQRHRGVYPAAGRLGKHDDDQHQFHERSETVLSRRLRAGLFRDSPARAGATERIPEEGDRRRVVFPELNLDFTAVALMAGAVYGSQETRFNLSNTWFCVVYSFSYVLLRLKRVSWDP